jgi:hypothetical protein
LLKKSLYGLVQSGRNWNERINSVLLEVGFTRSVHDPCVYYAVEGENRTVLGIFVDDDILAFSHEETVLGFIKAIKQHVHIVAVEQQNYLGLTISDVVDGQVTVSQKSYVETLLERYGMSNAHAVGCPVAIGQKLDQCADSPLANVTRYQELLGALQYLATSGRPDISFPINNLAQYNHGPRVIHDEALRRVLKYLSFTKHYTLHVRGDRNARLSAVSDASWNSLPGSKSVSGCVINIGKFPILWRTKRQPLVALSSCEAEVSAICDLVKDLIPIRGLIAEISPTLVSYPVVIETDSQSGIDLIRNGSSARSKHYALRLDFIREELNKGNIALVYRPGADLRADMLTKAITGPKLAQVSKDEYCLY